MKLQAARDELTEPWLYECEAVLTLVLQRQSVPDECQAPTLLGIAAVCWEVANGALVECQVPFGRGRARRMREAAIGCAAVAQGYPRLSMRARRDVEAVLSWWLAWFHAVNPRRVEDVILGRVDISHVTPDYLLDYETSMLLRQALSELRLEGGLRHAVV